MIKIYSYYKILGLSIKNIFINNRMYLKNLFHDDASYQNESSFAIFHAKKLQIKTIELQHGEINNGHPSFIYNSKYNSYIRSTLPEYLLTFGKFWSDIIRSTSSIHILW